MSLSRISLIRPVAMSCFILVLVMSGINSYRKLGLDNMPDIEIPYITIQTVYPGASPEEIEVDIAKKIEDAVSSISGLKHVHSVCMENICLNSLEFNLNENVDIAAMDVREKIDMILDELPPEAEDPQILKFDINAKPVATLMLTGELPLDSLYDLATEQLSDYFTTIPGVASVEITGGEDLEIRVSLDHNRLAASGLNSSDIIASLAHNNAKIPAGRLDEGIREFNVMYDSEFTTLAEISNLEVGRAKGRRIYLRDLAEVSMISEKNRSRAFLNGQAAVNMKIIKKGDANAVKVVRHIRQSYQKLQAGGILPGGAKLVWFTDDGEFINASVNDAWLSVAIGILLTALILFMFLHEIRSTIIIAVSMPTSIIVTFTIMQIFGYTFNNSTLLALGTSVGVLVTNSIVVIENIFRKLDAGLRPLTAAETGSGEVAIPVFASAMTNVVVFVPIALMHSLVGRYFVPFAVTMTSATLISLFISFTLTPILAAKFLRNKMPEHHRLMKAYIRYWERCYSWMENSFATALCLLTANAWITIFGTIIIFLATMFFIAPKVGMSFFPDNDRGEFIIKLEYPTYFNLEKTIEQTLAVENRLRQFPEVMRSATVVGKVQGVIGQASEGVYLAEITIKTSGKNDRKMNMDEMQAALRRELAGMPDCRISVGIPTVVGGAESAIQLEILGDDLDELERIGQDAAAIAENCPEAVDIDTSIRPGKPEIRILPMRSIMQDMSISALTVGNILRANVEGTKVGTYKISDRAFDIRVRMAEQKGVGQLSDFHFMNRNGKPLKIGLISEFKENLIPIQINRAEKRRIVRLYADPAPGVALGDTVAVLREKISPILPPGYEMRFMGQVEKMQEAQADFLEAIISAIVLTYLLIAAILESWTQPLLILFTLPLALIGIIWILFLTGHSLSMMGLLGAVMLIGIVVNNAILIIDELNNRVSNGEEPSGAMLAAVKNKFRPILMISLAAIIGIMPMALGQGLGSELRASCGITLVGGLISSSLLSLLVIPTLYILIRGFAKE